MCGGKRKVERIGKGGPVDIAILGVGNVGRALATSAVRAGHTVTVSSRKAEDAKAAAGEIGANAAGSNRAAIDAADVVVLAVPYPALDGVLGELGDGLAGKVLVDVTNRMDPARPPGVTIDGTSAAEQIQARAPEARVVKAFNTNFAAHMTDPSTEGVQVDCLVAGDDQDAKAAVLDLAESIGFRGIDAGPLMMSRAVEALALLNISLNMREGWSWQTEWKLVGPTGSLR